MGSMAISGIVFACGSAGALLGMLLRSRLPEHHLSAESKDVVKLAMGVPRAPPRLGGRSALANLA